MSRELPLSKGILQRSVLVSSSSLWKVALLIFYHRIRSRKRRNITKLWLSVGSLHYSYDEISRIRNKIAIVEALVSLYKALVGSDNVQSMDTSSATVGGGVTVTLEEIANTTIETILCPIPSVIQAAEEALMQVGLNALPSSRGFE